MQHFPNDYTEKVYKFVNHGMSKYFIKRYNLAMEQIFMDLQGYLITGQVI